MAIGVLRRGVELVDLARCVQCHKVIPIVESGCPYCGSEDPSLVEKPYLPLAIRLLLVLFVVNAGATVILAVLTLLRHVDASTSGLFLSVMALVRAGLAGAALVAAVLRRPWGRKICLTFVVTEIGLAAALAMSWISPTMWSGGMVAPIWNALFLFLFLRDDVAASFDHRVADRKAVGDLIRSVSDDPGR